MMLFPSSFRLFTSHFCLIWLLYNFHSQATIIWFTWIAPDGLYMYVEASPPLINTIVLLAGLPLPPGQVQPCPQLNIYFITTIITLNIVVVDCLLLANVFLVLSLSGLPVSLSVIYAVQYFLRSTYEGHVSYKVQSLQSIWIFSWFWETIVFFE